MRTLHSRLLAHLEWRLKVATFSYGPTIPPSTSAESRAYAALLSVVTLHTQGHPSEDCSVCSSEWPCGTLLAIAKELDVT